MNIESQIASALGTAVTKLKPLTGGCVGEVYSLLLEDGRRLVAKVDNGSNPRLDIEGYMLQYLAEHSALPVPAIHHSAPELLVMEFINGVSRFDGPAERHAAELLATLHTVRGDTFGLERATLIGGLHQPNTQSDSWVTFFREHRLLAMARQALDAGMLSPKTMNRIEAFAEKLDALIDEPQAPALLHGDIWSANVLAREGRIVAFIDPAIYYGHPEIELAFITMFSTFGQTFFDAYHERAPISPGFFESRRDIYNLYPLLVHVRLFGGGYVGSVENTLSHHGC